MCLEAKDPVDPEADLEKELGLDSLDMLELVFELEEVYEIEFDVTDLRSKKRSTEKQDPITPLLIASYIDRKCAVPVKQPA